MSTVTAPTDMSAFAVVSGDHNPIHTDRAAALLAGLKSPIVHGMWLSAAAQHVVTATDGRSPPAGPAARLDRPLPRHGRSRATKWTSGSTASESTRARRF